MTTIVKTVAFNLQNIGESLITPGNYENNNYVDNNYVDNNYEEVNGTDQYKSISHGNDFNKYQTSLKNKALEGFNGRNVLTNTSQSVLLQTQLSKAQQQELIRLKQEYVLKQTNYNSLRNTISPVTNNAAKLQQLAQLETTLDLLSQKINTLNKLLINNVSSVNYQISANSSAREKYMSDISSNKKAEANIINISNNIQNMLYDSDITTLQKNYSYILLSILAAASIIVAMNVINKN